MNIAEPSRSEDVVAASRGAAVITIVIALALILPALLLCTCDPSDSSSGNLPVPDGRTVYIRSIPKNAGIHEGVYAVDVDTDQVVGGPLLVGRADYALGNSIAIAPNGKFFLLRCLMGGGRHPFADHGLLILDPSNGWRGAEPPMTDDGAAVAISPDGKAIVARRTLQPDWTFKLDIFDTNDDRLVGSDAVAGPINAVFADRDGLVYVSHGGNMDPKSEGAPPAGIKVLRSIDLQPVASIGGYGPRDFALGPDGMLYGATNRRRVPEHQPEAAEGAEPEWIGLLVVIDRDKQQVVAELEVPNGAVGLAVSPDGKAYILHRDLAWGGAAEQSQRLRPESAQVAEGAACGKTWLIHQAGQFNEGLRGHLRH